MKRIKENRENGQTMILGVIALLILLLACLFLFDLHSIIRVKIKAQTAVDAAAVAAANWQVQSLNLIGELNLVKACTVLVSDITPFGDDSPEGLAESADILTEMQSRVSFVGPMIGFGAAQQAAKNNGMNPNDHYTSIVTQHIENLQNDDYYGEDVGIPQSIEGYSWRAPYTSMVEAVNYGQGGIAVAPNVDFAGLPDVDPPWLMDLRLYSAIAAEYWCYPTLRYLVKNYDFSGPWWQATIVSDSADFPEECEYSPLYVQYSAAGDDESLELAQDTLDALAAERELTLSDEYDKDEPEDTDGINSPLPYVKWCVYESKWSDSSYMPSSEWTTGYYLRTGLKTDYVYGGAVVKMSCVANPTVLSSSYHVTGISGDWMTSQSADISESTCTALAKPLGSLGSGLPPYLANMVLPVFDKARLIPVSMQDPTGLYDPFNEELYNLFEFLQWAADVSDIDNPGSSPPAGGTFYLTCLQELNDEEWRSKGYNRSYVETIPTAAYDPDTNPSGAGWLQMAYTYQYDALGNPIAILTVNEDTCDDWPSVVPGRRMGPPVLH